MRPFSMGQTVDEFVTRHTHTVDDDAVSSKSSIINEGLYLLLCSNKHADSYSVSLCLLFTRVRSDTGKSDY